MLESMNALPSSEALGRDKQLKPFASLTEADLDATEVAFVRAGGNIEATARLLTMHPNTVKYRLERIRERYNAKGLDAPKLALLLTRMGLDGPEDTVRRFALWASRKALREEGRYGLVLHDWLLEALTAWEADAAEKAREEAA